jgi:hypothetical protein
MVKRALQRNARAIIGFIPEVRSEEMVVSRIMTALILLLLCSVPCQATGKKVVTAIPAPKRETEAGKAGRYQLLPVEYTSNDLINETAATRKELILLDTATGLMQVCSLKVWTNFAAGKDISERKCSPFTTYAEFPEGTLKVKKVRDADLPRP